MTTMDTLWVKVTRDKYELIEAIGDTAEELAKLCGTTRQNIYSSICHAKRKGYKSPYRKIVMESEE